MRPIWVALIFSAFALFLPAQTENPSITEVQNAASLTPGEALGPGSLVAIFGSNFATTTTQAGSIPLSTSLSSVSVTFNGIPSPLLGVFAVNPNQVNAQLPWEVQPGTATVVVRRGSSESPPQTVTVAKFSPGIFALPSGNRFLAIVVNLPDGTVAQPAGAIPAFRTAPARTGQEVIVYATGLGPVDVPVQSGHDSMDTLRKTIDVPTVLVGNIPATVNFSGMAPQFVGVNQLNVVIPAGVPPGDAVPLQLQIGGLLTSDRVTIAVQ